MWLWLLSCVVASGPARADEPWLLDLEATGGAVVSSPQKDWTHGGASFSADVARPLAPWLLLDAQLRSGFFVDGERPKTAGVKDPGWVSLNSLTAGLILRLPDGTSRRATGPWIGANLGAALTGSNVRATWEAAAGYGFAISDTMALGPVVRYLQVVEPDKDLPPSDARIILAGVRLSLFDRAPPAPGKPKPTKHDRDGDGIEDAQDRCPEVPEDLDGFEDEDGCPELDNDRDSIADASDGCPNIAEDKDGFQDEDGCPDDDNDKDGILDPDDQCPLEPETVNGERDDDGCPDQGLIVMHDDRVVLEERVLFDTNSARIKQSAGPVLRAIVKLYSQHPEWTKVRIEGHADARGDAGFNQQLSERRASNVREALLEMGVKPEVVVAQGYGATRLLTPEVDDEGHTKNRRVEFVVIARVPSSSAPLFAPGTAGTKLTPTQAPDLSESPAPATPKPQNEGHKP
ncbi:MAG: Flagellar motor rotation protein MotB [Myxococcaceae bacterium]|nr:Flagellar motor rotation protein MotB [Myxococcaceae bacterium]